MRGAALLAAALVATGAAAEESPGEPARFTIGAEASAAMGPEDRGFFNYTSYEESAQRLARSMPRLERMPRETALVQSFLLGGEAIRVLATDPLLPDEITQSAPRANLHALMLRYDAVGHRLWRRYAATPELTLVQGGRA